MIKRQTKRSRKEIAGIYRCTTKPLVGHRYTEIMSQARRIFRRIQKQTKRRPYIRSAYFMKDKIFFDYFWMHLNEKQWPDRMRRLKYFPCALELLRSSTIAPITSFKTQTPGFLYHEFTGNCGEFRFTVVIKQDRSSGKKYLLSIFPISKI